jgi:hypothetical protein
MTAEGTVGLLKKDIGQVSRLYGMVVSCSQIIKTNTASVLGCSRMVQFKMYLGRILNEQKN